MTCRDFIIVGPCLSPEWCSLILRSYLPIILHACVLFCFPLLHIRFKSPSMPHNQLLTQLFWAGMLKQADRGTHVFKEPYHLMSAKWVWDWCVSVTGNYVLGKLTSEFLATQNTPPCGSVWKINCCWGYFWDFLKLDRLWASAAAKFMQCSC